mmetsp:Transcript_22788/g.35084  ORF Transcript_22788/g.35084 Transcript_22788/m.35084 type:complete len:80 (+) Transcript_22788:673-912(+)
MTVPQTESKAYYKKKLNALIHKQISTASQGIDILPSGMHKSTGRGKEPHLNQTTTQNKMIHKGIAKLTFYHNNNRDVIQ